MKSLVRRWAYRLYRWAGGTIHTPKTAVAVGVTAYLLRRDGVEHVVLHLTHPDGGAMALLDDAGVSRVRRQLAACRLSAACRNLATHAG